MNGYRARLARRLLIGLPFAWLALFLAAPFFIVIKISLSEARIAMPPYGPLTEATFENFAFLFTDRLYLLAYLNSLKIAFIATLICLVSGYPMAWIISRYSRRMRNLLLLLVVIPSWTSFLIRVYAWMGILGKSGFLNGTLLWLGIIDQPLQLLRTDLAVYIGIVYTYLPFMVLPVYANLMKLDNHLIDAAADLGAPPWRQFVFVILPLSRAGIIAGCMLVFIPAAGEFVIPELLGGADTLMIGKVLWQEFFNNRDWPIASAVTIILLLILLVPGTLFFHNQVTGSNTVLPGLTGEGGRR